MTDKVQKIREEVERLKEETSIGLSEHENGVEQGRMEIINALSLFLDSLQEKPISENLEEACEQLAENARKYKAETSSPFFSPTDYKQGVMDGARWQKNKMMQNTIDAQCFGFQGAALFSFRLPANNYLVGSEVKVIVIKED